MAGLGGILIAVARVAWRETGTIGSVFGNHFFFIFVIASHILFQTGYFMPALIALLLLVPLSNDPLRRIPDERLALWPLDIPRRIALRIAGLLLTPIVWLVIGAAILIRQPGAIALAILVAVVGYGVAALATTLPVRTPSFNLLRYIPDLGGSFGLLVSKNLREMLCVLDTWLAAVIAAIGIVHRLATAAPEPNTLLYFALFPGMALSSHAQCLFALDTDSGFDRYALLPLRGWRILAAKDVAFLTVLVILCLPSRPVAGLAVGLTLLVCGRLYTVRRRIPQARWRFTTGASVVAGLLQVMAMMGVGVATDRHGVLVLLPCLAVYGALLWYGGRELEQRL